MVYTYKFYHNTTEYIPPDHKTAILAGGCFWCMEEAFERYVPGVVEAISGYSGGSMIDPVYENHGDHYEVILVVYDPSLTSYETIIQYYWRNVDPFNPFGQFCDFGHSYLPVIFHGNQEERRAAKASKMTLEITDPERFGNGKNLIPIKPVTKFWEAEEYHQNYYLTNEDWYWYYKTACRRVDRLKEVWGEEEYMCFHDDTPSCEIEIVNFEDNAFDDYVPPEVEDVDEDNDDDGDVEETATDAPSSSPYEIISTDLSQTVNEDGEIVDTQINLKNSPDSPKGGGFARLPWEFQAMIIAGSIWLLLLIWWLIRKSRPAGSVTVTTKNPMQIAPGGKV